VAYISTTQATSRRHLIKPYGGCALARRVLEVYYSLGDMKLETIE
jgi:hypothetical protein